MGHGKKNTPGHFLLNTSMHFFKATVKIALIIVMWTTRLAGTILVSISQYLEKHVIK